MPSDKRGSIRAIEPSMLESLFGKAGQGLSSVGESLHEALSSKNHPTLSALAQAIISDPALSAGSALQDWTGTPRETSEEYPYRKFLHTGTDKALIDPRILDVAGFAQAGVAGAKRVPKLAAEAIHRGVERGNPLLSPQAPAYVIKPEGGNWYGDILHRELESLANREGTGLNEVFNTAMQKWIMGPMAKYIKNEMGTPSDPIRRLADEGIYHFQALPIRDADKALINAKREIARFPQAYAQTERGNRWEGMADKLITNYKGGDYKMLEEMHQLRNKLPDWVKKVPPETRLYDFGTGMSMDDIDPLRQLGMRDLTRVVRGQLNAGDLRPENLNTLTIEQAVRRAHNEREAALQEQKLSEQAATKEEFARNLALPVVKDYGKYKMVRLPTAQTPEGLAHIMESGCRGRWCTKEDWRAKKYSNPEEGTYLDMMIDETGRPHILSSVKEEGGKRGIPEIRPISNEWDSKIVQDFLKDNPDYRNAMMPHIQDYIRSGDFDYVNTLFNADMHRTTEAFYPDERKMLNDAGYQIPEKYMTDQELDNLAAKMNELKKATENKAEGGQVQRLAEGGQVKAQHFMFGGLAKALGKKAAEATGKAAKEGARDFTADAESLIHLPQGYHATKNIVTPADYDPLFGYPTQAAFDRYLKTESRPQRLERLAEASKKRHPGVMPASEALGWLEGLRLRLTQADRMRASGKHQGGSRHPTLQHENEEFKKRKSAWAVGNEGTATSILNLNKREPTVWTPFIGSEYQHASNFDAFNQIHKAFENARNSGEIPKEQLKAIIDSYNNRLNIMSKKGKPLSGKIDSDQLLFPEKIDLHNPNYKDLLDTYDKRREFANALLGEGVGGKKGQIFDIEGMLKGMTEPSLLHVPKEHVGDTLFGLSGDVVHKPVWEKGAHPAYPYLLEGEDSGMLYRTTPAEALVPGWVQDIEQRTGRKIGGMDYRMNAPNQFIHEDYLNWLRKLGFKEGGQVKGYKKGGKVTSDSILGELTPEQQLQESLTPDTDLNTLMQRIPADERYGGVQESPLAFQASMARKRKDIPEYLNTQAQRLGQLGQENIRQFGREAEEHPVESALDALNPGGAMAGVIRKKGNQWLDKNMPAHMNILLGDQQYPNAAHNQALAKWIKGPMTKYLKNEMATPEDPIRKLAESNITHNPVIYPRLPMVQEQVQKVRQAAGFPEPMGQSEFAKKWEDLADSMITSQPAHEIQNPKPDPNSPFFVKEPPAWIHNVPPEEMVHDLPHITSNLALMNKLGMTQMRGFLRREMEQGNLRPENLNALTMEQAVRRMHDARIEADRVKNLSDQEKFAQYRNFPLHKEYKSGWRWVDLPDADTPEGFKTVKDIGCAGGWCTMKDTEAKGYGSKEGGNTLRALLDPTGRPHIQAHSEEMWDGPKNLNKTKLTQIKPFNNTWESARVNEWTEKNPKYRQEIIPMMQDYIRSGNFHEVRDYNNADLFPSESKISPEGKALLEKSGHKVPTYINEQERGDLRDKLIHLLDLGGEL